ncbi:MAG: metalloregulator ArsR/SmtB family transcription factor [Candidatus Promineifilaceae bacterium]|nr:metalloregulator ArsR/SmtB family transcription factor [Candidatus Promineifilaceae bacterium]
MVGERDLLSEGAEIIQLWSEPCCTLEIAGAEEERLIAMFKALGNPTRFEILKYLLTHPGCITGDIVDYLPIAQSTVSQHLKVLRDAGWIVGVVDGPAVSYCLHADHIAWFKEKVGAIF